jgi:hypothetical protein
MMRQQAHAEAGINTASHREVSAQLVRDKTQQSGRPDDETTIGRTMKLNYDRQQTICKDVSRETGQVQD